MTRPNQKISFEETQENKSEIIAQSILAVFIFSMITATSLSINSLIQLVFETYVKTPRNKILANLMWVLFNFALIITLLLIFYKNKVIRA